MHPFFKELFKLLTDQFQLQVSLL